MEMSVGGRVVDGGRRSRGGTSSLSKVLVSASPIACIDDDRNASTISIHEYPMSMSMSMSMKMSTVINLWHDENKTQIEKRVIRTSLPESSSEISPLLLRVSSIPLSDDAIAP